MYICRSSNSKTGQKLPVLPPPGFPLPLKQEEPCSCYACPSLLRSTQNSVPSELRFPRQSAPQWNREPISAVLSDPDLELYRPDCHCPPEAYLCPDSPDPGRFRPDSVLHSPRNHSPPAVPPAAWYPRKAAPVSYRAFVPSLPLYPFQGSAHLLPGRPSFPVLPYR